MIQFKMVRDGARLPTRATDGAIGYDFYIPDSANAYVIRPQHRVLIGTGWSVETPAGAGLFLFSRSGHGAKSGIRLANCVGVVDPDYRGEVMGSITNDGIEPFTLQPGDRFMQGVFMPVILDTLVVVSELSETARGEGGFGSTGASHVRAD